MDMAENNARIQEIETLMSQVDFWADKNKAQALIRELEALKDAQEGIGGYDKSFAIITILSGAGGDDAEDFSRMLFQMYDKYCTRRGWTYSILHEHENDHGGYRNITFEIQAKGSYGVLKNESGVHRLVRLSPFNSKAKRNTSFSLVEVVPKLSKTEMPELEEADIVFDFSKAGGPGGQNVNKRETAVRVTHKQTGITVSVREERSQEQNRERALEVLRGKLFAKAQAERKTLAESLKISKTTDIEWGNQIRNYVLHPYKLVKDLRTGVETANPDAVFDGELDQFIEAELIV